LQQEAARICTPIDLVVLEAGSEAGGHARTIIDDGFIVDRGPDGFVDLGAETLALIDELNLRARLIPANPIRNRYILSSGALRRVPSGPASLLASDVISWRGKLRMMREPWAAPPPPGDKDETVFEFAERRIGREAAETLVDTAVGGISGGDSRALSVKSQFPLMKEMEREHGSLVKAMFARRKIARPRLWSFDRGMGTMTADLASRLSGSLRVNTPIDRLEKTVDGWRVRLAGGAPIEADHVILALPAHAAARLTAGFDKELSRPLAAIPYVDFAVVGLAYRASEISRPLDGTGYLVARSEDLSTLGVLWESSLFPQRAPQGMALLRVILGGARRPEVSGFDDQSVAELAVKEATGVIGISGKPVHQWVSRWPSAIAQYTVGHEMRTSEIKRLAAAHPGLHVCGTAYD